ncbi:MAG: penicillin-binding protein activator [Candidatus Puniceispirillaceae bacterium]
MFWRIAITVCLPVGLAACGVAVDQASLPGTAAPETAASRSGVSGAPVADSAHSPSQATETALLAPSVTGSIDGLIDSIVDTGDADSPAARDQAAQDQAAADPPEEERPQIAVDDGIELPVAEAPAITDQTITDQAITGTPSGDVAQADDPEAGMPAADDAAKATAEIVDNIIWNIQSAKKDRVTPEADPVIPVGPDPSLASDALEAAFAMLARREQGLPEEGFLMPRKAPGVMRIALLVPTSGANNILGSELQRGAELALFSLRNRQIELLVFDTVGAGADIAAREAIQAEADIIVGPLFSDAVVPARQVAAEAGVPMLALSNNTQIAADGSWLLGYVPEQQVDLLLGHALTTGRNKVGIIAASDAFGQRIARHARKRLAQFGITPEDFITLTPPQLADEDELKAAVRTFTRYQPPDEDEEAPASFELPPPRFDAVLFAGSAEFALRTAPVLAYYDADPERVLYLGNAQWNQRRILMEPSLQGGLFASRPTDRDDAFNALWSAAWDGRPGALARLSFDAMAMAAILAGQQPAQWDAALQSGSGFNGFSGAYRLLPGGGNQRAFEIRQISGGVSTVLQPAPDKI